MDLSEHYKIPVGFEVIEEEIKHSRFITLLFHCPKIDSMKLALTNAEISYPNASHYCYAYIAGAPNDVINIGSSDAGEPSGSAGRPMLTTLQGANIGEIAAIVVRYFGGTKLGLGGLMRAYTSGIKQGLNSLNLTTKYIRYPFVIKCNYNQLANIEYLILSVDGVIIDKDFGEQVIINFELAKDVLASFNKQLASQTQGQLQANAKIKI